MSWLDRNQPYANKYQYICSPILGWRNLYGKSVTDWKLSCYENPTKQTKIYLLCCIWMFQNQVLVHVHVRVHLHKVDLYPSQLISLQMISSYIDYEIFYFLNWETDTIVLNATEDVEINSLNTFYLPNDWIKTAF